MFGLPEMHTCEGEACTAIQYCAGVLFHVHSNTILGADDAQECLSMQLFQEKTSLEIS